MNLKAYIFYAALLLAACTAEQNNPLVIPTCSDKIKNQDETDVDCGGRCTACKIVLVSPCSSSLVDNRITYKNNNISFSNSDMYVDYNYYGKEITIWKSNFMLMIDIYTTTMPTEDTLFPITSGSARTGYASIWIADSNQYATSGDVYVLYDGYRWTIEFCSVNLRNSGGTITNTISGRILYSY